MFLPTIDVDNRVSEGLSNGNIDLQTGQWIRLQWSDRRARYIGRTPSGSLVVQHWDSGYCPKHFRALVQYQRGTWAAFARRTGGRSYPGDVAAAARAGRYAYR